MQQQRLIGKRVAVLYTDGVEQVELTEPVKALEQAGADVTHVSLKTGKVRAWNFTNWGDEFPIDEAVDQSDPARFDALLLPGGVMNPDTMRMHEPAVRFVRRFFDDGKPIAAICHGPWMLVEADIVRGKTVTSYPSLKTDIRNAGGMWVDREVVTDQGIVTSRNPNDIPAFNQKTIEEIAEGSHLGRRDVLTQEQVIPE
jgi:protease I